MNQPPPYPPQPEPVGAPPRPPRWGRFAAWTAAAAVAAFTLGSGLAVLLDNDDGEPVANPAACKEALAENLREATAAGESASPASAPPACVGLDRAVLERITGEVISEYWESPEAEKLFEDAWRDAAESAYPSP